MTKRIEKWVRAQKIKVLKNAPFILNYQKQEHQIRVLESDASSEKTFKKTIGVACLKNDSTDARLFDWSAYISFGLSLKLFIAHLFWVIKAPDHIFTPIFKKAPLP